MRPQISPEDVFQTAVDAYASGDWRTLADLVHPDALASLRTKQLGSIVAYSVLEGEMAKGRSVGFSPSDFAKPEAIEQAKHVRISEFPNAPTIGELGVLSPPDFFIQWCEAAHRTDRHDPRPSIQKIKRSLIGQVIEGENLAHVLYRLEVKSNELAGALRIMSLKRDDERWLLLLNDDIIWPFSVVDRELK